MEVDNIITIKDKRFSIYIGAGEIENAVSKVALAMNEDLKDKDPLFIAVLNGAFMFASDLMKKLTIPCSISFVKLSSYQGTQSTETVKQLIGLQEEIKGRTVVIVEDIIDTGLTVQGMLKELRKNDPADIRIATMVFKPNAFKLDYEIDYIGLEIPNDFIVGYGLDYDGYGRNYADIYRII